jgi:hypothetical protein
VQALGRREQVPVSRCGIAGPQERPTEVRAQLAVVRGGLVRPLQVGDRRTGVPFRQQGGGSRPEDLGAVLERSRRRVGEVDGDLLSRRAPRTQLLAASACKATR